jgi:glycosyltransferase involved in cell wall biosynthesis
LTNVFVAPKLSVILPVYNGRRYLEESINSVLSQSFVDFELIIMNDGSTDDCEGLIEEFRDMRIRYFKHENKGLSATLNIAIRHARGRYIARQDQDDICLPLRFQKQIDFLDMHPDVGMVGTAAHIWAGSESTDRRLTHPIHEASLRMGLLVNNLFVHSSIMIRRCVFEKVGGYCEDNTRQPPEDYELWSRVMREFRVANLPDVLMIYREVANSMSRTGVDPFGPNLIKITSENIAWASGWAIDSPEVVAISRLSHGAYKDIPQGMRFAGLSSVVRDAANKIAIASCLPVNEFDATLQARLKILLYQYMNYRTGGILSKVTRVRLGRYVRGIARRMLSLSHP